MKDYCEEQTGYMEEGFASSPYSGCDEGIILGFESLIVGSAIVFVFSLMGLYSYTKNGKFRIFVNKIFSRKK